ncbi:MAG: iron-containing alcohol dehydrogenase [Novosphingobium sp.]
MAAIHLPRTIRIGGGTLAELPQALAQSGLSRPAIVTDAWIAQCGVLDQVLAILAEAGMPARAFAR